MDSEEWIDDIYDAVISDVQASGYFDYVNEHESKRKPGRGLTAAVWVQSITPLGTISGLAATSGRVTFQLRAYKNMISRVGQGPQIQDSIDRGMTKAMSNLMRRYHGDFDFDGIIRNVDLLGHFGVALSVQSGYLEQDKLWYRTMDMMIPCIVNDIWPQVTQP